MSNENNNNNAGKSKMNRELKSLLSNLNEAINSGKESQRSLDRLVTNAVQYIDQCPQAFDSPLPKSEDECIQKIVATLNARQDGELLGEVFQEHYNKVTESIDDQRMRDLLANLVLCSLEDESQVGSQPSDMGLLSQQQRNINLSKATGTHTLNTNIGQSLNQNGNSNGINSYDATQLGAGLGTVPVNNFLLEAAKNKNAEIGCDVVQSAIYSFMGVQGKYLKKNCVTGRFKLDPVNAKCLMTVQCGMLLRLSELGYYHDQVAKFANVSTGYNAMGSMGQAFMAKLKEELSDLHGQIAMLQDELTADRQANLTKYIDREQSWLDKQREPVTLLKLLCWYMKPLRRMQWLTKIADACQLKKGGELAMVIYSFRHNGDSMVDQLVSDLLTVCCGPLVRMISKWMLEGGIDDSYGEFFIESLTEVGADRLWHDKFRLRRNMLPKFISMELAVKILKTGKSINFLREICKIEEAVKGRMELKNVIENSVSNIFSPVSDTSWHAAVETCYAQTSKHVLDIMVGPHKLLVHLQGMRRYLLLGQGDFVTIFIENIKDELEKNGCDIYSHDLSSKLDTALRCTNAQYDDPDIVNHLDVVIKTPYPGDYGWDVISLQYTVHGPLSTMLEPAMPTYKSLFKPLWRIKHMEFVLSTQIWKVQMANAKALRALGLEIHKATYMLHLFTSEMMHFVHQMQYYVLFEVIECNWVELLERMQNATALDDILDSHSKFLEAISIGCFVNSSADVESHLEVVYGTIINLEVLQTQFYEDCLQELTAREKMMKDIVASEKAGSFGLTTEQKLERDQASKIFEQKVSTFCLSLDGYANKYGKAVGRFLLALNSSDDPNLQLFGTRLDFNEYYKKRDTNLSKPLTFEHMRLSSVMCNSKSHTAARYNMLPPTLSYVNKQNVA